MCGCDCQENENSKATLSLFCRNWSWNTNNEYGTLQKTNALKVSNEDWLYRGKNKKRCASDYVTWRFLIQKTRHKRDKLRECNDLSNFIKKNTAAVVHIIPYFCGCRPQQEIVDICVLDWTDHSYNCIEVELITNTKQESINQTTPSQTENLLSFLGSFFVIQFEFFFTKGHSMQLLACSLMHFPVLILRIYFELLRQCQLTKDQYQKHCKLNWMTSLLKILSPGNYSSICSSSSSCWLHTWPILHKERRDSCRSQGNAKPDCLCRPLQTSNYQGKISLDTFKRAIDLV